MTVARSNTTIAPPPSFSRLIDATPFQLQISRQPQDTPSVLHYRRRDSWSIASRIEPHSVPTFSPDGPHEDVITGHASTPPGQQSWPTAAAARPPAASQAGIPATTREGHRHRKGHHEDTASPAGTSAKDTTPGQRRRQPNKTVTAARPEGQVAIDNEPGRLYRRVSQVEGHDFRTSVPTVRRHVVFQ